MSVPRLVVRVRALPHPTRNALVLSFFLKALLFTIASFPLYLVNLTSTDQEWKRGALLR
jgi:hypothetical protein